MTLVTRLPKSCLGDKKKVEKERGEKRKIKAEKDDDERKRRRNFFLSLLSFLLFSAESLHSVGLLHSLSSKMSCIVNVMWHASRAKWKAFFPNHFPSGLIFFRSERVGAITVLFANKCTSFVNKDHSISITLLGICA